MSASPYIFDTTDADFENKVLLASTRQPVLVDFWAPWCAPCKQLTPIIEKLVNDLKGKVLLAKVNTDEQPQLAGAFGVRSLPTVMLIKDGRPLDGFMGVQPESVIKEWLAPHLAGIEIAEESDADLAPELDPLAMVAAAREAIAAEPDKAELKLDLLKALLAAEEFAEAETLVDGLPANLETHDQTRRARAHLDFIKVLRDAPDEAALGARLAQKPDDHLARYQWGCHRLLGGDHEAALDAYFEIMRSDRKFEDDLGRKALIAAFLLIDDADLVSRTRKRMAAILF